MNKLSELIKHQRSFAKRLNNPDVDKHMLSKFANGRCNPTVDQAREICEKLGRDIYDVWQPSDLDYSVLHREKIAPARKAKAQNPRVTHRVSPERYADIINAVAVCEYGSMAHWLEVCIYRLLTEAKKKAPAAAGTAARAPKK